MMKVKQIASLLVSLGATVAMSYAQSVPATLRESATSKYDYSEAFAPFFLANLNWYLHLISLATPLN
mgnify:CR=1 FL=1